MRHSKHKNLALIFLLLVCVSTGIIILRHAHLGNKKLSFHQMSPWLSRTDLLKSGYIAQPKTVLAITFSYTSIPAATYSLTNMKKIEGYVPTITDSTAKADKIILYDKANNVISTAYFTPPDKNKKQYTLTKNIYWNPKADHVGIVKKNNETILTAAIPKEIYASKVEKPSLHVVSIRGDELLAQITGKKSNILGAETQNHAVLAASTGVVNIVILSDNYTTAQMSQYHADANAGIKALLNFEPFHSRAAQFMFHIIDNTTDLQCADHNIANPTGPVEGYIECNAALVTQALNSAGVPSDAPPGVMVNEPTVGAGFSFPGEYFLLTNSPPFDIGFAHEFGHTFGDLLDEYSYGSDGTIDNQVHTNCYAGVPPAPQWANLLIPPASYTANCQENNWYASGYSSVMTWAAPSNFDVASQAILNAKIDSIAGKFIDTVPPTCTVETPNPGDYWTLEDVQNGLSILVDPTDNIGTTRAIMYDNGALVQDTYTIEQDLVANKPIQYHFTLAKNSTLGLHQLEIKVFDVAGNVGSCTTSVNVVTTLPSITPSTISPTIGDLSTTPGISPSISQNTSPTPTGPAYYLELKMSVFLHGIFNGGDNINASGGNKTPVHTTKTVHIEFHNASDALFSSDSGTFTYDPVLGEYSGFITTGLPPDGSYTLTVYTDHYLHKNLGIFQIKNNAPATVLPKISLVAGDINNDNRLDILDYNALIGCFGTKAGTSSCTDQSAADINDDGAVNGVDYNLFLRELSVQRGN